ncbi:MAG TPA: DsbA family protein, partial [bacterium]|nr:DsbA family protein [bacterium]
FRPVLEQVDREYPELRRVTVLGGLRGDTTEPMSDELAQMIQNVWHRIEETTGQPFNHELWRQHRPLGTTWPACKAVLSARLLRPEREWPFMVGMFQAYFTQGLDPTRRETHLRVADGLGFDVAEFDAALGSPAVQQALLQDLQTAARYGVTGFPTVVLSLGKDNYLIAPGYQPIEVVRRSINAAYKLAGIEYTRPESGLYS